jgi:hypothetical protein
MPSVSSPWTSRKTPAKFLASGRGRRPATPPQYVRSGGPLRLPPSRSLLITRKGSDRDRCRDLPPLSKQNPTNSPRIP